MNCPACNQPLPGNTAFCPHCGRPLTEELSDTVPATRHAAVARTAAASVTPADLEGRHPRIGEEDDPLIGTSVAGRFRVRSRIGAGGMGTVYLAEQTAVDRPVVLKFLHRHLFHQADSAERFHREALAASKLTCPNTIVLHDFGQTEDGTLFMAMEYLEGRSLGALIAGAGALPAMRAIAITLQMLTSLEEAHAKGIVHRDLKPENIMLVNRAGTGDFVKVLDFGIAKLVGQAEPEAADEQPRDDELTTRPLTREGAICGSPGYMAPEQVLGQEVDHRADIYAVGVILYEMLSGQRPFQGSSLIELMDFAVEGQVESLHDSRPDLALPRPLDRLLMRCLHRDPRRRPDSAADLAASLRGLTPEIGRQQQEQERALMELVGIRRRWTRHLRWAVPAGLALLLAVGLALGLTTGDEAEGVGLAPGERVFVAASAPRVPAWVAAGDGLRAEVRDLPRREQAVHLARTALLARLADVPPRFDPGRERQRYLADLEQLYQHARTLEQGTGRSFVDSIAAYWVKLAVGQQGSYPAHRYDAYAHAEPLTDELRGELRRMFAEVRYDRYSFLTDEAVRRKRCPRARELAAKVEQTIQDMQVKKPKQARLRFILKLKLRPCGSAPASAPSGG